MGADAATKRVTTPRKVQRQLTDTLVMEATTRARKASEACSDS